MYWAWEGREAGCSSTPAPTRTRSSARWARTAAPYPRSPPCPACSARRRSRPTAGTRPTSSQGRAVARAVVVGGERRPRRASTSRCSVRRRWASRHPGPQLAFIGAARGDRQVPLPVGPLRHHRRAPRATSGRSPAGTVVSFFWSPDGRTIATIGRAGPVQPRPRAAGDAHGWPPYATTIRSRSRAPAATPGVDVSLVFVDVASGTATPAVDRLTLAAVREPGAAVLRPVRAQPPGLVARRDLDPPAGRSATTASSPLEPCCRPTGRRARPRAGLDRVLEPLTRLV